MLFSVEQAFVGKDEKRAPLKTHAWEAIAAAVQANGDLFCDCMTVYFICKYFP